VGERSGQNRSGRKGGPRPRRSGGHDGGRQGEKQGGKHGGDRRSRHQGGPRRKSGAEAARRRKTWDVSSGQLPHWISEELARVTPKGKLTAATETLQQAAEAFAAGKHGRALKLAVQAKELSPRDATVRELLALSAYRLGQWDVALRELRTYRRYTGDTTHLPVEMDVLRAMDRSDDVEAAWDLMRKLGGTRDARNEARVVFGAHLLDRDEPQRAWDVTNPGRIGPEASESDFRVWYVAARAAAELGDRQTGRRLFEAIQRVDPAFPALDELDRATRPD
jgi:hypothetical protein